MGNLDGWKIGLLLLLGIFLFGPERLPKIVGDALRIVRVARRMARDAAADVSREIGVDLSVEDLHPKTFLRKHLLGPDDGTQLIGPLRDAAHEAQNVAARLTETADSLLSPADEPKAGRPGFVDRDAT